MDDTELAAALADHLFDHPGPLLECPVCQQIKHHLDKWYGAVVHGLGNYYPEPE